MSSATYFLPVLMQLLLTLLLYIVLAVAKGRAIKADKVDLERRALHADAWPDNVQKINNNIRNQFELPVLYYVLMLVLWQLNQTGYLIQLFSWMFVISRYLHAWVHIGPNLIPLRRRLFTLGFVPITVLLLHAFLTLLGPVLRG